MSGRAGRLALAAFLVLLWAMSALAQDLPAPPSRSLPADIPDIPSIPRPAPQQEAPSDSPPVTEVIEFDADLNWPNAGIHGFIDVRQRPITPQEELLDEGLRFLTSDDFPPFNHRGEDGYPDGYHVELARALCEELRIACTMQVVAFADIPDLLAKNSADVALAGLVNHPSLQEKLGFSAIYLKRPARFVVLTGNGLTLDGEELQNQPVAVRGGTAHEAFLKAYFPQINRVPVTDLELARKLLVDEKVTAIFGDAFKLLPMVTEPESPITFVGKPFYDDHFFGDGMAIAYGRGNPGLKKLLDFGLLKLAQKGRMSELYARFFALDIYAEQ